MVLPASGLLHIRWSCLKMSHALPTVKSNQWVRSQIFLFSAFVLDWITCSFIHSHKLRFLSFHLPLLKLYCYLCISLNPLYLDIDSLGGCDHNRFLFILVSVIANTVPTDQFSWMNGFINKWVWKWYNNYRFLCLPDLELNILFYCDFGCIKIQAIPRQSCVESTNYFLTMPFIVVYLSSPAYRDFPSSWSSDHKDLPLVCFR